MKGLIVIKGGILAAIAGCSFNNYVLPEDIENTATLSGSRIERDGLDDLGSELVIKGIDGFELNYDQWKVNYDYDWPVASGVHEISLQVNKKTSDLSGRYSVYPEPILILLEEGQKYRIAGKYLRGSFVAYWIEEVNSGLRISPRFYDPPGMPESVYRLLLSETKSEPETQIVSSVSGLFSAERALNPGENCLLLIREIWFRANADSEDIAVAAFTLLSFLAPGSPGVSLSPAGAPFLRRYEYEGLTGLCFNAVAGHRYEIRPSDLRADPYSEQIEERPSFGNVQIWDNTESRKIGEFSTEDMVRTFLTE